MNLMLRDMLRKAEGRYFNEHEIERLNTHAEAMIARLDALQAIERAEAAILEDVVGAVMSKYPGMASAHGPESEARVRRDQMMVLRYASFAMVLHDPGFLMDKLSLWLRTILGALCDLEQVRYGYEQLMLACERHLTQADFNAVLPYLELHYYEFREEVAKSKSEAA